MVEYSETGEAFWCAKCLHHPNDHKQKPSNSPNFFYQAREYLHCREGCSCKKFIPYMIDVKKVNELGWQVPPELQGKPRSTEDNNNTS